MEFATYLKANGSVVPVLTISSLSAYYVDKVVVHSNLSGKLNNSKHPIAAAYLPSRSSTYH